jgi:hypothetical protein
MDPYIRCSRFRRSSYARQCLRKPRVVTTRWLPVRSHVEIIEQRPDRTGATTEGLLQPRYHGSYPGMLKTVLSKIWDGIRGTPKNALRGRG